MSKQYTAQEMVDRCLIIREVQNIVGKVAHCDMLSDYDLVYPNFWSRREDVCLGFNNGYFKGTDFALRPGYSYASLKTEETTPCDKHLEREFGEPTQKFTAYDSFYNYFFYPEITMEHATFADAISNGPEGNPNYKG